MHTSVNPVESLMLFIPKVSLAKVFGSSIYVVVYDNLVLPPSRVGEDPISSSEAKILWEWRLSTWLSLIFERN